VEVPAALWRKQRSGELTVEAAATLAAREADAGIQGFACFAIELGRAATSHDFTLLPATM
jgi:hypothetical protein